MTGEQKPLEIGQEGIDKYVGMYNAGTPVYIITGEEANVEYKRLVAELVELRPDGVLQKPFGLQEIKDLIEQIRGQIGTKNPPYQL